MNELDRPLASAWSIFTPRFVIKFLFNVESRGTKIRLLCLAESRLLCELEDGIGEVCYSANSASTWIGIDAEKVVKGTLSRADQVYMKKSIVSIKIH